MFRGCCFGNGVITDSPDLPKKRQAEENEATGVLKTAERPKGPEEIGHAIDVEIAIRGVGKHSSDTLEAKGHDSDGIVAVAVKLQMILFRVFGIPGQYIFM